MGFFLVFPLIDLSGMSKHEIIELLISGMSKHEDQWVFCGGSFVLCANLRRFPWFFHFAAGNRGKLSTLLVSKNTHDRYPCEIRKFQATEIANLFPNCGCDFIPKPTPAPVPINSPKPFLRPCNDPRAAHKNSRTSSKKSAHIGFIQVRPPCASRQR